MAPRTCPAVTLRGMKPNNGCFVESAIVFGLEVCVQAQGEPDAENMIRVATGFALP
jgi:hypothetical protein